MPLILGGVAVVVVLGVIAAVAASSGSDQPKLAAEQPGDTSLAGGDVTTTTAAALKTFTIGDRVQTAAGNFATAYAWEQPVKPGAFAFGLENGEQYAAADVEACAGPNFTEPIPVNPFDYQLIMPDNSRLQPDVGVRDPALNSNDLAAAGDCIRGWVTFKIPAGVTPRFLVNTVADPQIRWAIP